MVFSKDEQYWVGFMVPFFSCREHVDAYIDLLCMVKAMVTHGEHPTIAWQYLIDQPDLITGAFRNELANAFDALTEEMRDEFGILTH